MARWTVTTRLGPHGRPHILILHSDPGWFVRDEAYVIDQTRAAIETAIFDAVRIYQPTWSNLRLRQVSHSLI